MLSAILGLMKERLEALIATAIRELFSIDSKAAVSRPTAEFGDYATNAALQIAPQLSRNPRDVAEQPQPKLQGTLAELSNGYYYCRSRICQY